MLHDSPEVELVTDGTAVALVVLLASVGAATVFFFTRNRRMYYALAAGLVLTFGGAYWIAVKPEIEAHARAGAAAAYADKVVVDSAHKSVGRDGRFAHSSEVGRRVEPGTPPQRPD